MEPKMTKDLFKSLPTQKQVNNYDAQARKACFKNIINSPVLKPSEKIELCAKVGEMFVIAAEQRGFDAATRCVALKLYKKKGGA
jgi:hypothetical protein